MKGMCICPFHEDHSPSLSLDFSRNLYYCFVCAEGGSIVNFVMSKEDLDYAQAISWLNEFFGSDLAAGARAKPLFSSQQIDERARELFWVDLWHFMVMCKNYQPNDYCSWPLWRYLMYGNKYDPKNDWVPADPVDFIPNMTKCKKDAEKHLYKERLEQIDRKKNPMKYIFAELTGEIEYCTWLIEADWITTCLDNDHIKM